MNAHEGRSTGRRGDRGGRLDRRDGLAGEDGLVALQLVGLQQPQVGGDQVTHAQGHHVAGDQLAHVQTLLFAVAPDQGLVADVGVQRGDRQLRAVLVDEAQPHAQDDDRGDDRPVGGVAGGRGDACRGEQQDEQRVAELTARTPRAVTLWVASTLRPTVASRLAAWSEVTPTRVLPSSWSTTLTGLWAAAARSSGGRCDHAGGAGEATLLTACSPSRGGPSRVARSAGNGIGASLHLRFRATRSRRACRQRDARRRWPVDREVVSYVEVHGLRTWHG